MRCLLGYELFIFLQYLPCRKLLLLLILGDYHYRMLLRFFVVFMELLCLPHFHPNIKLISILKPTATSLNLNNRTACCQPSPQSHPQLWYGCCRLCSTLSLLSSIRQRNRDFLHYFVNRIEFSLLNCRHKSNLSNFSFIVEKNKHSICWLWRHLKVIFLKVFHVASVLCAVLSILSMVLRTIPQLMESKDIRHIQT